MVCGGSDTASGEPDRGGRAGSTAENPDLYCLVTHDQPCDEGFWNIVRQGAKRYG